ncbi:homeobox domain protein [Rhizoctonia solani]|uniref:Homeobox domain protein n=1 Tax=Rhizoctonia solani TaxID=456999 RepID=A0A8H8T0R9_9AGAM|nr:homeobox domain protein [Rhizoctonia solani]QRW24624.1 homeobox domain protein [Rhizoctonia solani]
MDKSLFHSVFQTIQKHATFTPDQLATASRDHPLFDCHFAHTPISIPLPDLNTCLSSFNLPPHLNNELQALLTKDLSDDGTFIAQTQQRLLQQLSRLSTSSDPTRIPSLVHAALDAFLRQSVNSRIEALCSEISEFSLQEHSPSDSDYISDSESVLDESDNGEEDEETEGLADDDDNAPIRPEEDIPPLETKYLPIFEALHERGKVLTKPEKTYLVNMTGMTYRQITIWFQNRRRGELKEHAQRTSLSHTGSVNSCASSEVSDDEGDLEQRIAVPRPDATFDIRSWRLTSALPIKAGTYGSFPTSPMKVNFDNSTINSDSDSGDTDLSDDFNEGADLLPSIHAPSLSTSITTINSTAASNNSLREVSGTATGPVNYNADDSTKAKATLRITKGLPTRHNDSNVIRTIPVQPSFTFNFGHANLPSTQSPPISTPPHSVTSSAHGLTIQVNATLPSSTTTLQSLSQEIPSTTVLMPIPVPSSGLSPQNSISTQSSQRSSTPSGHSASSPRPITKPLPRRTGCAPRPRPPPRASPPSVVTSGTIPGSKRASIVLPPSSNPSLGNTTLGSLLCPNQPAPRIPQDMEERLTAMAGRMGVGSRANPEAGTPKH